MLLKWSVFALLAAVLLVSVQARPGGVDPAAEDRVGVEEHNKRQPRSLGFFHDFFVDPLNIFFHRVSSDVHHALKATSHSLHHLVDWVKRFGSKKTHGKVVVYTYEFPHGSEGHKHYGEHEHHGEREHDGEHEHHGEQEHHGHDQREAAAGLEWDGEHLSWSHQQAGSNRKAWLRVTVDGESRRVRLSALAGYLKGLKGVPAGEVSVDIKGSTWDDLVIVLHAGKDKKAVPIPIGKVLSRHGEKDDGKHAPTKKVVLANTKVPGKKAEHDGKQDKKSPSAAGQPQVKQV